MDGLILKLSSIVLVLYYNIEPCLGQSTSNNNQAMKIVLYPAYVNTMAYNIFKSSRNDPYRFPYSYAVCVRGIWALYSNNDFGEGYDNYIKTSVIVLKSGSIPWGNCTLSTTLPGLKSVKSYKYLGDGDLTQSTITIYSETGFLGMPLTLKGPPTSTISDGAFSSISGIPLGSIAITGNEGLWKLCPTSDCSGKDWICINMKERAGIYVNENVGKDANVKWPTHVRKISVAQDSDECKSQSVPLV